MISRNIRISCAAALGTILGLQCLSAHSDIGSGTLAPVFPGSSTFVAPALELSPVEKSRMLRHRQQLRDQLLDEAQQTLIRDRGLPAVPVTQTALRGNPPQNFIIGKNARNSQANAAGQSTLAEPAAINNNGRVFAAGNFNHAEYSTDHGTTWTQIPLPGGPARAPYICCDHDAVIDDATRTGFHSVLYLNIGDAGPTNGIVRIFVRQASNLGKAKCFYDIAPEFVHPAGTSDDIVPDYPHLALTRNYLYLAINAVPADSRVRPFPRMYRISLAQMSDCQVAAFDFFDRMSRDELPLPQRVWVPASGGEHQVRMLWVQHDSQSVLRIFDWPETARSPTEVTRTVQTSNFSRTAPDCRGGIEDFNFIEAQVIGFAHRCAIAQGTSRPNGILACYWNAGADETFPQALVRSAVFSLAGLDLIAQPHIWNANSCFGYAAVTANSKGDIGLSIAAGGRSGGGGEAVQGYVGIDDQFIAGEGSFGSVYLVARGVANRVDGRFGDYLTVHPYQRCDKWFGATSYAWSLAPVPEVVTAGEVNSRWVEFGRDKYLQCYNKAQ